MTIPLSPCCISATLLAASVAATCLGQPSFQGLGLLPGASSSLAADVSADGVVVVGWSGPEAFRWTPGTGMVGLGQLPFDTVSYALSVSADGSVVVGAGTDAFQEGGCAFKWTEADGMAAIGTVCDPHAYAFAVSADGSIVAGEWSFLSCTWTQGKGVVPISPLGGWAFGISADGSTVVGEYGAPGGHFLAYRWTRASGLVGLGTLPGGYPASAAGAASADGTVVVGASASANTQGQAREAFRWTAQGGMIGLGDLPGGPFDSSAARVSADGSVVVGSSATGTTNAGSRAFIWTAHAGMQDLREVLASKYGVEVGDWVLFAANGMSGDGRHIVGVGLNPASGQQEAWVAYLGPCLGDFNHSSSINSQDFFDFLTAFFASAPSADFNHDTFINSQDFFEFLAAFFAGC